MDTKSYRLNLYNTHIMKKLSTIIMAIALVLGLAYCKKQETPDTPVTVDNWVRITMRVGAGGRNMDTVYPGSGAVVYEEGDSIYVGCGGYYRGKLGYQDGAFIGSVADPVAGEYLDFYYLGKLTPNPAPTINVTTDFTVRIDDQSSGLNFLSYGRSTERYSNGKTSYTSMLMNQCGLVRFMLTPEPSTTNSTVTISGMKTTATINFGENPGITPTGATGLVTLHKAENSIYTDDPNHPKERWAILLPQPKTEAMVTYTDKDENTVRQTINLPAIEPNCFYGGYSGIPVGLEWVDLGLEKGTLWATCNVGSCTPEGFGTFFAWAETEPKSTYCWHSYKYAFNPKFYEDNPPAAVITAPGSQYSSDDTLHHERSGNENKPNLGFFRYNTDEDYCLVEAEGGPGGPDDNTTIFDRRNPENTNFLADDDAAYVNWGKDWRIPTAEEWGDLLNETTQEWDVVNGVGGMRFTGKINDRGDYTDRSIFLPAAGVYGGPMHSFYYGCGNLPHGEYWSNEINPAKPYQAYILYFDDPYFSGNGGSMDHLKVASEMEFTNIDPETHEPKVTLVEFIRNQGRPVRAVRTEEDRK